MDLDTRHGQRVNLNANDSHLMRSDSNPAGQSAALLRGLPGMFGRKPTYNFIQEPR